MGGKLTSPFGGWYHATKFAVEGFSDCLRTETAPFGIDVIVVEPGGIKTDWGTIAAEHLKQSSANGAYAAQANHTAELMNKLYSGDRLSKPEVVASAICKAVTAKRPRTRYLTGYGAKPAVFLRRIVSDRVFDSLFQKIMS
jgi:NAD(P)-dependent dehydrogenase (short-subunit alcohol dehydrogenase family)